MHLFDVATVIENGAHWPSEGDSRGCSVRITAGEACGTDNPTLTVVEGQGDGDTYRFLPFYVEAELSRRLWCSQEDDETWLAGQLRDSSERAVLLALQTEPYAGAEVGFWAAYAPVISGSSIGAKFIALREEWAKSFVAKKGEYPIAFVSAFDLGELEASKAIWVNPQTGEITSLWGDPVIATPGLAAGQAYLTGDITVYLSPVQSVNGLEIRGNRQEYRANRLVAVDTAPCAIYGFAS